jgi:hypothetical protein
LAIVIPRLAGLLRDTWWLWALFLIATIVFAIVVSLLFLVMIPVLMVAIVYYASLRYDDQGKPRG